MSSSYRPNCGSLSMNYMESGTGTVLKLYLYIQGIKTCMFCSPGVAVIQPKSRIDENTIHGAWMSGRCASPMAEASYFGSPEMNRTRNQRQCGHIGSQAFQRIFRRAVRRRFQFLLRILHG